MAGRWPANSDADWNIVMDYYLSQPVIFDGVVSQWLVNGTPVDPLFNFSGICCASSSNPILPGEAHYNSGFSAPLPAGSQTNWQEIYADPYSIVSEGGIDPSTANEFIFALHFTLQAPEPASLSLLGAGLVLPALRRWRRRA